MGRALARAFIKAGHPTTVWNRTTSRADDLVADGAVLAPDVAAAVRASPVVVVCVLDATVVRSLLEPVREHLEGHAIVNLTSSTPEVAQQTSVWAAEHGLEYLDGAIMVPTPLIGGPDALVLYSGSMAVYETHQHTLAAIGGDADFLGTDAYLAAVHDLGMLSIFFTAMTSFLHAASLVGAHGMTSSGFVPYAERIVSILPATFTQLARDVDAGHYPGDEDQLRMEKAALEHIIEASEARGVDATLPGVVTAFVDRAIAQGHGADGFSRIVEELRSPLASAR